MFDYWAFWSVTALSLSFVFTVPGLGWLAGVFILS